MDVGMEFENAMRLLFGEKAYQIAGTETQPRERKRWILKTLRKLMRDANELDTTTRHKKLLMAELESISHHISDEKCPVWILVYRLIRLSLRLLGYDFSGARCHTPVFYQATNQYYTTAILSGKDTMQDYYDRRNAIAVREKIVDNLSKQGLDTFTISLVLNTTEYEVKKLRIGRTSMRKRRKP